MRKTEGTPRAVRPRRRLFHICLLGGRKSFDAIDALLATFDGWTLDREFYFNPYGYWLLDRTN